MGAVSNFVASKFYMSLSGNASYATAPSERYKLVSESVRKTGTILYPDGTYGSRSPLKERTRASVYTVGGTVSLFPTPAELRVLLPRILGGAEGGSGTGASPYSYALAETLPEFYFTKDLGTKVFHYTGCKVARATFSAAEGQPLRLDLDLVGKTEEVGAAASISSPPTLDTTTRPYMFTEAVLTALAAARLFKSFRCTIDNMLKTDRFTNSITVTAIPELGRMVGVSLLTPYEAGTGASGHADLYDQALDGAALTVKFTSTVDANKELTFSFATVQFPAETPMAASRDENNLELNGVARKSGSTDELAITQRMAS